MLTWREEEGAVDQRIPGSTKIARTLTFCELICSPLKDVHHAVAEDARHPVHLVGGKAGEDEAPCLVVADAALVLHLVGHELVIGVVILIQSISP